MIKFTRLIILALLISSSVAAQDQAKLDKEAVPKNWHQLDEATSGYNGISLDKAYAFVKTKNLKSKHLIIAVIDSGIDTLHEDLKPILWTNPKEIPGNGIDDDHNGYIDDVHGWNFIGGKDGRNVKEDSYEGARVYHKLKLKWENKTVEESQLTKEEKAELENYKRAKVKIKGDADDEEVAYMRQLLPKFTVGDSTLRKELGKEEYNANDLMTHSTTSVESKTVKAIILSIEPFNFYPQYIEYLNTNEDDS